MHSKLEYKPIEQIGGRTPGPGTYEANLNNKKKEPSYGYGSEKRNFNTNKSLSLVPAANTYNPNMTYTQKGAAKWGFGSETRKGPTDEKKSFSPGPGNYAIESVAFDIKRPRFFMGQKIKDLKPTTAVPGAGQYNPSPERTLKSLPSYSMKMKLGSSLETSNSKIPGPGNYEVHLKNKKESPKFGFGSSIRESGQKKLEVPGPGAYKINTTIGDVPAYAMPGRKEEYKFV